MGLLSRSEGNLSSGVNRTQIIPILLLVFSINIFMYKLFYLLNVYMSFYLNFNIETNFNPCRVDGALQPSKAFHLQE